MNNENLALLPDGNYWIRAILAAGCKGFEIGNEPDERQGVLRYNASSTGVPTTFRNASLNTTCRDENYTYLHPIVSWTVPSFNLSSLGMPPFRYFFWSPPLRLRQIPDSVPT